MWLTGLVALWHVGSSRTRARTRVPCIGRRILNHCATREALKLFFKKKKRMWRRGGELQMGKNTGKYVETYVSVRERKRECV